MKGKRRCKHKHKHRLTDKKKERHDLKKLRRAQRRGELQPRDSDNELDVRCEETEVQHVEQNRQRVREARKQNQRKGREMTISRFRQIAVSDCSEDEEEEVASSSLSPDVSLRREEPKIPSCVGKHLRKKVNKLSNMLDSSLSLSTESGSQ